MKQLLIIILTLLCSASMRAQYVTFEGSEVNKQKVSRGKKEFRIQLGVGSFTMYHYRYSKFNSTVVNLSFTWNYPLGHNMGLEWGLNPKYNKGVTMERYYSYKEGEVKYYESNRSMIWLEVPVMWNYRYNINKNLYIRGLAGLFLQPNIYAKIQNSEKHFYEDSFRFFEAGLKIGIELGWSRYSLAWHLSPGVDFEGDKMLENTVKLGFAF